LLEFIVSQQEIEYVLGVEDDLVGYSAIQTELKDGIPGWHTL
jgi:hypothetical protein